MNTWIIRVQNELHELQERINKLQSFLISDDIQEISITQLSLLSQQLYAMKMYENILKLRIIEGETE